MWETGGTGDLGSVDGHSPHTINGTKSTSTKSNSTHSIAAFTELELIDLPAAMIPEHAACRLLRATPASAASAGVSGTVGGGSRYDAQRRYSATIEYSTT